MQLKSRSVRNRLGRNLGACSLGAIAMLAVGCAQVATASPGDPRQPAPAQASKPAKRPNILFIALDDLRPDIGAYGNPVAVTPNMDALAKSGMVFDRAYTQQAVCAPSRAALMTGLRPDTTGITTLQQPLDKTAPDAVTMIDLFKGAGYATLGYGKIYHHRDDDANGWTLRTQDQEYSVRQADRKAGKSRLAAEAVDSRDALPDTMNVKMAMADMAKYARSGQPFMMMVGIHKPHLPFDSPKSDWARYQRDKVPPPVNPDGQKGAPPWALVAYEVWNYDDTKAFQPNMPADKTQELRHAYLAAVSYADGLVGDLLAQLKAQGLEQDTIVVLWGDHGWKIGDHGKWAKHSNAELDIRIPVMIRVPGVTTAGARSTALVETVDLYPTLAELAGLKAPAALEGLSMRPLLADPQHTWKQAAFAQFGRNGGTPEGTGPVDGRTVRTARYRYTAWVAKKGGKIVAQELYDLQKDPVEAINVATDPAYAVALKEHEAIRMGGWQKVRAEVR